MKRNESVHTETQKGEDIRSFHDAIAPIVQNAFFRGETHPDMADDFRLVAKIITKTSRSRKGGLCLDLGCGIGYFSNLAAKNMFVIGVDFSRKTILQGNKLNMSNEFIQGNILNSSFKDNCFDIIQSTWTIEFIMEKTDLLNFANQVKRMLKRNGILILVDSLVGPQGQTEEGSYITEEKWMQRYGLSPLTLNRFLWRPNTIEKIFLDSGFDTEIYEEGKLCWILVCRNGGD